MRQTMGATSLGCSEGRLRGVVGGEGVGVRDSSVEDDCSDGKLSASSVPLRTLTTEASEGMETCTLLVASSSLALETGSSPDGVDGCDGGDGGVAAAGSGAVEVAATDE